MPDIFNPSAGMFPGGAASMLQTPLLAQMALNGGSEALSSLLASGMGGNPNPAPSAAAGMGTPPMQALPMQATAPASAMPPPGLSPAPTANPATQSAPGGPMWMGYQPNIFGFEGGNGAVGNGGGQGQFEPNMRAAFVKANPQFAGVAVNTPAYQNAAYKWMGNQITSANPEAATNPSAFYASYALGPTAAKVLSAAPPNADAAAVIGGLPDGATLIKGNPELFRGNATAADALTRAGAIAQGKWGPNVGTGSPAAPPPTPVSGAPATPPPGVGPGANPSGALINQILGKLPAGGPTLARVGGMATNPLFAAGAAGLAQEPAGSAGSIIGHMGQAYQQASLQKPLINNQVALQGYNAGLARAKDATQLGMLGAYKVSPFQQPLIGPDGSITAMGYNDLGQHIPVPLAGPGGNVPGVGNGFSPEALVTPGVHATAANTQESYKLSATDFQDTAKLVPGLQANVTAADNVIGLMNNPATASMTGTTAIAQGRRFLAGLGVPLAGNPNSLSLTSEAISDFNNGNMARLKPYFRYMAGPELKIIGGQMMDVETNPKALAAIAKESKGYSQAVLGAYDAFHTLPAAAQKAVFSSPTGFSGYMTANVTRNYAKYVGTTGNQMDTGPSTTIDPSGKININVKNEADGSPDAATAKKQAQLNSILYGN